MVWPCLSGGRRNNCNMDAYGEIIKNIYIAQAFLFVVCLVQGARDGFNYSIHGKPEGVYNSFKNKQKWWHWLGGTDYGLCVLPFVLPTHGLIIIAALLLRIGFFDLMHNKYAGLNIGHIGTEAGADKFFAGIFGKDGAVRKMWAALLVLLIFNLLNEYIR